MRLLPAVLIAALSCPVAAHAGEWRWCAASDVTSDDPYGRPTFFTTDAFDADEAPDYEAQFAAYARTRLSPIRGEFTVSCSPALPDKDAALQHFTDWVVSLDGAGRVEGAEWTPQTNAAAAPTTAAPSSTAASSSKPSAADSSPSASAASTAAPAKTTAAPSASTSKADDEQAEKRRQEWERERVAAQNGSGAPLRFRLIVSLVPQAGDTSNMQCYSSIIVRSGPAGWGGSTYPSNDAIAQAQAIVESAKPSFVAKCAAVSQHETQPNSIRYDYNDDARASSALDAWQPTRGQVFVQMD